MTCPKCQQPADETTTCTGRQLDQVYRLDPNLEPRVNTLEVITGDYRLYMCKECTTKFLRQDDSDVMMPIQEDLYQNLLALDKPNTI